MAHQLTTCTFCGVGCGIYLETFGNQITGAYPSMSHPSNQGRICVRGWNVHEVASSPDRLKQPLLRRNGDFAEVSWEEAVEFITTKLNEIRTQHGPDALAFLNSPRCSNEESYLLQKLARSVIGTNNVDHGAGVYGNNSIDVLLDMLGVPASTNSIGELAQSDVILVDNVDLARQLPTIGGWVLRAKLEGAKLIVADSRWHRVAESADQFLQLWPGTEAILYGAMAKVIVDRGLVDLAFVRNHCRDYPAVLEAVRDYDLLICAQRCGVPAEQIEAAAVAFATVPRAAILYSTGMETRSQASIQSLVNLLLLTGNIGRQGSGLFALAEQNNMQGVCDMGVLPNRLPGYVPVEDARFRGELEKRWGCTLPGTPGMDGRACLGTQGRGKIRGLWLCRYDPVSTAFFGDAAATLQQLDLVVVQHCFRSETSRYADVILPMTAFGEERITFTSTDRRIQLAEKVIDPPEGPLPSWQQITRVAQALHAGWDYETSADVMDEIREVVPAYSGASYVNLSREYGRQWPCTSDKPLGTRYLFEEGIHGRPFRLRPVAFPSESERDPNEFPLILVFGRSLYYWHQNVLIQHSETLQREYRILLLDYPNGFVEVHPQDANELGVRDGDAIQLRARTGSFRTAARVTAEVRRGTVFVPYFVRDVENQILGQGNHEVGQACVRIEKE